MLLLLLLCLSTWWIIPLKYSQLNSLAYENKFECCDKCDWMFCPLLFKNIREI